MPGRGRGVFPGQLAEDAELRRPLQGKGDEQGWIDEKEGGGREESEEQRRQKFLTRILSISSPDDLEVQDVAKEITNNVTVQDYLEWLVSNICDSALTERKFTPVGAKLLGIIAYHQAGEARVLRLLMTRLEAEFAKKDDLLTADRQKFVTSAQFLGEAYHFVKTETNCHYSVLADPALQYLNMIIEPHITNSQMKDQDEDMQVVAKLLLQNGLALHKTHAAAIQKLVLDVTEVLCCRELQVGTRLNLMAALGDLWPCLASSNVNVRILHATLAAKLGVGLNL